MKKKRKILKNNWSYIPITDMFMLYKKGTFVTAFETLKELQQFILIEEKEAKQLND